MRLCLQPSKRAQEALHHGKAWDLMQRVKKLPQYDPDTQPDGVIDLSGAMNSLMDDLMRDYVSKQPPLRVQDMLSYGPISGSPLLLQAAAGFFNRFFSPSLPISADDILAANGVTSLIDLLAWTLCDPGEGVLYPTPNFYMLEHDLTVRADVRPVAVSTTSLDNPFEAGSACDLVALFEQARVESLQSHGTRCKMLFLCNPANPQGRCYASKTLESLADWCARHHMHLVVDEIYALSSFASKSVDGGETFTSVLSIPSDSLRRGNVHCLYGMSKDFNMGGLRMGFLVSRNEHVRTAASRATWFTWITTLSDAFVCRFLSDLDGIDEYIEVYRGRLREAYHQVSQTLNRCHIPFLPATAGLFVFIDLSSWLPCLPESDESSVEKSNETSQEMRLCQRMIDHGVFLNPGEFAGSDQPGWFRLVFTEFPQGTALAIERIHATLKSLEDDHYLERNK